MGAGNTKDIKPTKSNDAEQSDQSNIAFLAKEAAQEFEKLAIENQKLLKKNEQSKQKYDDLLHEMQEIQHQIKDIEVYKEENQNLITLNAKYQTEAQIFEQEKVILQETIDQLKQENNNNLNNASYQVPDEYNNDDMNISQQSVVNIVESPDNANEQRLMVQVTEITKEKKLLEVELEELKMNITKDKNEYNALNQRFIDSQKEIDRLNNDLTEQQNNYIKIVQSRRKQTLSYDRKLSVHSDQIANEYKTKQEELLKQLKMQKKKISELEVENEELQKYKIKFIQSSPPKKDQKMHIRLRTQQNVFGDGEEMNGMNLFGLDRNTSDPFGLEEDDMMELDRKNSDSRSHSSHRSDVEIIGDHSDSRSASDEKVENIEYDGVDPEQHGAQELKNKNKIKENMYIPPPNKKEEVQTVQTKNGCNCFSSFFNKFKKKKQGSSIDLYSKPLLEQQ